MGQVIVPSSGGITVVPTDRESGPGAGAGASGNRAVFLGASAGLNSTISDVVVVGNSSLSGGAAGANGSGSVIVGSKSAQAVTSFTASGPGINGPLVVLGSNTLTTTTFLPSSILIGGNILPTFNAGASINNIGAMVVIGDHALGNITSTFSTMLRTVAIGTNALRGGAGGVQDYDSCVYIGDGAGQNANPAGLGTLSQNTVIGAQANPAATFSQANTLIGYQAGTNSTAGGFNSVVGANTVLGAQCDHNAILGQSSGVTSVGSGNVLVGANVVIANTGNRNIWIGRGAGTGAPASIDDSLLIESNSSGQHTYLYSLYNATTLQTNMVLGQSTEGTNRDVGGSAAGNIVKLINGTKGTNPVGGGYFYVSAGALHWVGSSGTDTPVAPA